MVREFAGRTPKRLTEDVRQLEARIETLEETLRLYEAENAWLWAELHVYMPGGEFQRLSA